MKKILYFYSVASPWSYLGIKRLKEISKKYSAQIIEKPIDLVGKVFVATGGTPVPQRHISRQNYRLLELKRWGEFLNIKINQKPKFFPPKDPHLPALFCLASIDMGISMDFSSKVLEHLWVKENDISNIDILKLIADDLKISFEELSKLATSDKIKKIVYLLRRNFSTTSSINQLLKKMRIGRTQMQFFVFVFVMSRWNYY